MNKQIILGVGLVSSLVALGFAAIGAWLILPFAGLELLALSGSLYWVNLHQNYRQILWLEQGHIRIEKGYYRPNESWRWALAEVAVHVSDDDASRALNICLSQGASNVEIGEFLTREDSHRLLTTLRQMGLSLRGYSQPESLQA